VSRARLADLWREPLARLLAVLLLLVPLAVVLVLAMLPGSGESPPQLLHAPITVTRSLTPSTTLFGDRIEAEVDVLTDGERIDPDSVQVTTDFQPYEAISTARDRSRRGAVTLLRTRVVLACLTTECLAPSAGGRLFRFRPLTVTYRRDGRELSLRRTWEPLQVYSRLGANPRLVDSAPGLDTGFRVPPTLLRAALLVLAGALVLAGTAWVVTGLWPRFPYSLRRWRRLSPLEQALARLDAAARIDDEATRRRVLDQLASQLEENALPALERHTRGLAWGEATPDREELDRLGEDVRRSLNGGRRG
jgi:hypothetical protein